MLPLEVFGDSVTADIICVTAELIIIIGCLFGIFFLKVVEVFDNI